jgi:hypothetical protein
MTLSQLRALSEITYQALRGLPRGLPTNILGLDTQRLAPISRQLYGNTETMRGIWPELTKFANCGRLLGFNQELHELIQRIRESLPAQSYVPPARGHQR